MPGCTGMKASNLALLALSLFSFAAVGCGTSIATMPLNTPPHALRPRSPEQVEVFVGKSPTRDFVEVAMIDAQQETYSVDDEPEVLWKMRQRAGEIGCDGLMIVGPDDAVVGDKNYTWTEKGFRGACLVWMDDPWKSPTGNAAPAPPARSDF